MNQRELEHKMAQVGAENVLRRIESNENAGRADENPYSAALYKKYILPLVQVLQADRKATGRPGRHKAHSVLLKPLDEYSVALLAVRSVVQQCLYDQDSQAPIEAFTKKLGKTVHSELVLSVFAQEAPELFWELYDDLSRRHSKNERHRRLVFSKQAEKAGIDLAACDWGIAGREQVGGYLLDMLRQIGMVEIEKFTAVKRGRPTVEYSVSLSDEALDIVESITEIVAGTSPARMPCVEQPRDWVSITDGGYHTPEMQRTLRSCVRTSAMAIKEIAEHDLSITFRGLNTLQAVRWRVNRRVFEIVSSLSCNSKYDIGDLFVEFTSDRPDRPDWLDSTDKANMTEGQMAEFLAWKREVRQWHEVNNDRAKQQRRTRSALRVASEFKDCEAIYFIYQADFRGRMYALSQGLNPQGSDLQKALIEFAEGKPLLTDDAKFWFKVSGANRYGVDKESYADRVRWVDANHQNILRLATDPYDSEALKWLAEADAPMQFLAWAIEYADWIAFGNLFRSHLAVGMDGSCNGLQNFSAMLRDEVGGKATNLVANEKPQDIYRLVAERTIEILNRAPDSDEFHEMLRTKWLTHGLTRKVVKRSVMTLPYGSTRFTCAESILKEYLQPGNADDVFSKHEQGAAAQYLSFVVWKAIADVVVKAREAMDYLQKCVKPIMLREPTFIKWLTPTGFPVVQGYLAKDKHRINSLIMGGSKVLVHTYSDRPDKHAHKNGIAPNFIHSMDAAHMCLTAIAAKEAGINSVAMIHDDFGTHAADAGTLYTLIRQVFVDMYTKYTPLEDFAKSYGMPFTIAKGNLDIADVLESPYFFG